MYSRVRRLPRLQRLAALDGNLELLHELDAFPQHIAFLYDLSQFHTVGSNRISINIAWHSFSIADCEYLHRQSLKGINCILLVISIRQPKPHRFQEQQLPIPHSNTFRLPEPNTIRLSQRWVIPL